TSPVSAALLEQLDDGAGLLTQVLARLIAERARPVRVIQMTHEPLHRPPGLHHLLTLQVTLRLLQSTGELMGIHPGHIPSIHIGLQGLTPTSHQLSRLPRIPGLFAVELVNLDVAVVDGLTAAMVLDPDEPFAQVTCGV